MVRNVLRLKDWSLLPQVMQNEAVSEYYEVLRRKNTSLIVKRTFDIVVSLVMIIVLLPVFLLLGACIKLDSKGSVLFRQERVTQYARIFRIYKFRTMVQNAESLGSQVTVKADRRVTRVGKFLRKFRLDELPQLFNIFLGDMSFVGTRPEVKKYTDAYTDEMLSTLLLPAGVTSLASIKFKDEEKLLENQEDVDRVYLEEVLPQKMAYNLQYIREFSFFYDVTLMFQTLIAVLR